jgi:hypothetical protein
LQIFQTTIKLSTQTFTPTFTQTSPFHYLTNSIRHYLTSGDQMRTLRHREVNKIPCQQKHWHLLIPHERWIIDWRPRTRRAAVINDLISIPRNEDEKFSINSISRSFLRAPRLEYKSAEINFHSSRHRCEVKNFFAVSRIISRKSFLFLYKFLTRVLVFATTRGGGFLVGVAELISSIAENDQRKKDWRLYKEEEEC